MSHAQVTLKMEHCPVTPVTRPPHTFAGHRRPLSSLLTSERVRFQSRLVEMRARKVARWFCAYSLPTQ